ncbi:MAG: hypothetical protein KatS3mg003_1066 [Candidatus Nitrosocaldaceae archaeon]|nr:MAG: hypothetical protein KatS3mg003_1066 [Candidatus Nitrosocaldaceae archaeon]
MLTWTKILKQELTPSESIVFDPTANFGNYQFRMDDLSIYFMIKITHKPTNTIFLQQNITADLARYLAKLTLNQDFKVEVINTDTVNHWMGLYIFKATNFFNIIVKFEQITINPSSQVIRNIDGYYYTAKIFPNAVVVVYRFKDKANFTDLYIYVDNYFKMDQITDIPFDRNIELVIENIDSVNPRIANIVWNLYRD